MSHKTPDAQTQPVAIAPVEFLQSKYGQKFEGHLSLWNRQTKQTLYFSCTQWGKLQKSITDLASQHDLYAALGTQSERLPANRRGSTTSVLSVPGFVADIDFAASKSSKK